MSVCLQDEPERAKGSQTDEGREAAAHSTKALFPWKIALHLLCVCVTACKCVCAVLVGWSLFTCEFMGQHLHAHLHSQAKPRQVSVGRPIYSSAEGRSEISTQEITSSRTNKTFSYHPACLVFHSNFNWTWSMSEENKFPQTLNNRGEMGREEIMPCWQL